MREIEAQTGNYKRLSTFVSCNQLQRPFQLVGGSGLLEFYISASQSAATRKAYSSDIREYLAFGGKLPASTVNIAQYLAASSHLAISTLKRRLAALADAHVSAGFPDPTKSAIIVKVLRGIARVHGAASASPSPILPHDLSRMVGALPSDLTGLRDKALLLAGFVCALRRSELVAVQVDDLSLDANYPATLMVRRSKTDRFGRGCCLSLPTLDDAMCPVAALRDWLSASSIVSGPVFRPINRWGHVGENAMSSGSVRSIVRERAKRAGLVVERVSAHSLRSGFAVGALNGGISLAAVRAVTRHQTLGGVAAYVRTTAPPSVAAMKALWSQN